MRSEEDVRKKIDILTKHLEETNLSRDRKQFTDGVIVGLRWALADEGSSWEKRSSPRSQ